ncbi:MAG: DUF2934 domain-containing protein [Gammaproteobacteria bacterium]
MARQPRSKSSSSSFSATPRSRKRQPPPAAEAQPAVDTMIATSVANAPDRRSMIAQAAYFKAERRGFSPGQELQDWIEAEQEISAAIDRAGAGSAG